MLTRATSASYLLIPYHNQQHSMVMQTSDVEATMALVLKSNKNNRPSKDLQKLFIILPAIKEHYEALRNIYLAFTFTTLTMKNEG